MDRLKNNSKKGWVDPLEEFNVEFDSVGKNSWVSQISITVNNNCYYCPTCLSYCT